MRRLARLVVARGAQRGKAFERELGVDGEQPGVAGQADDAIGAGSVGEGELELVSAHGQAVAHDRLHPPLTEGAAGLLVGENVLERHHFAGHFAHARLRRVDHGETLVELAETFARRLRLAFEPCAESRPDRIEPVGDDASEVRLPRPEPFRHAANTPAEFRARLRKRGEARLDRLLPFVGDLPLAPPRGSGAPKRDQAQRRERSQQRQSRAKRLGERDRDAVDDGDRAGGHLRLADALCVMAAPGL